VVAAGRRPVTCRNRLGFAGAGSTSARRALIATNRRRCAIRRPRNRASGA
jgi:hypothetical protein